MASNKGKLFKKVKHDKSGIEYEIRHHDSANGGIFRARLPMEGGTFENTDVGALTRAINEFIEKHTEVVWKQVIYCETSIGNNGTYIKIQTGWVTRKSDTHMNYVEEYKVRVNSSSQDMRNRDDNDPYLVLKGALKPQSEFAGQYCSSYAIAPADFERLKVGEILLVNSSYAAERKFITLFDEGVLNKLLRLRLMAQQLNKVMKYFFGYSMAADQATKHINGNLAMLNDEEGDIQFSSEGVVFWHKYNAFFGETVTPVKKSTLSGIITGLFNEYARDLEGERLQSDSFLDMANTLAGETDVAWQMDGECPSCGHIMYSTYADPTTAKCSNCDEEFAAEYIQDLATSTHEFDEDWEGEEDDASETE